MPCAVIALALLAVLAALAPDAAARAEVGVKKTDTGVEVTLDGKPFTTYVFDSGFKPILWPMHRADGQGDDAGLAAARRATRTRRPTTSIRSRSGSTTAT